MHVFLISLLPWGYNILLGFETIRTPFLDIFFSAVTRLGEEKIWIVMIAVVYWSINKETGRSLSFIYLTSSYLNMVLKYSLMIPRPDDPRVQSMMADRKLYRLSPLDREITPAWPSNHAQGTLVGWLYLAAQANRIWIWFTAFAVIFLVGFSRMYLGVHYPQDIIGGWLVGYIFLKLWLFLESRFRNYSGKLPVSTQAAVICLAPMLLSLIWPEENASKILGAFAGLGVGFILESRLVKFVTDGPVWRRIARSVAGLVPVLGILAISVKLAGIIGPDISGPVAGLLIWIPYFAAGLTASFITPWILVKLRLADSESE